MSDDNNNNSCGTPASDSHGTSDKSYNENLSNDNDNDEIDECQIDVG